MDATLRQQIIEREVNARLYPKPGDPLYIHLADLLAAIQKVATLDHVKILDYGAGLAPYRRLFPHADYRTADVGPSLVVRNGFVATPARNEAFATPDYTISADGSVEAESCCFDYVLSTQALEHVVDPQMHLAESLRVLTPGGKLILTTHGMYEDHGSPYDFRRWTADGLQYDLRKTGFEVLSIDKITTGPRAVMWFFQTYLDTMSTSRKSMLGLLHWICRAMPRRWIHNQADRLYSDCRIVPSDVGGHNIYLCLAALAQRPLSPRISR